MTQSLTPDAVLTARCRAAWFCGVCDALERIDKIPNGQLGEDFLLARAIARRTWFDGPDFTDKDSLDLLHHVYDIMESPELGYGKETVTHG